MEKSYAAWKLGKDVRDDAIRRRSTLSNSQVRAFNKLLNFHFTFWSSYSWSAVKLTMLALKVIFNRVPVFKPFCSREERGGHKEDVARQYSGRVAAKVSRFHRDGQRSKLVSAPVKYHQTIYNLKSRRPERVSTKHETDQSRWYLYDA